MPKDLYLLLAPDSEREREERGDNATSLANKDTICGELMIAHKATP